MNKKEEIQKIIEVIRHHDYLYNNNLQTVISDDEYDQLYQRLISLEERYPEYVEENSPTQEIRAYSASSTVNHKTKMLSLAKVFSLDDLHKFLKKNQSVLGVDKVEYIVEQKYDGVAFNAIYFKGNLKFVLTRGDGNSGEPIVNFNKKINNFPQKISHHEDYLEVRGELYLNKSSFIQTNNYMRKKGFTKFANCRNLTAGIVKIKTKNIPVKLNYFAYGIGSKNNCTPLTQKSILEFLDNLGFNVNGTHYLFDDLNDFGRILQAEEVSRPSLEYDIDGLVIKINNTFLQEYLGEGTKTPNHSIAYKFKAIISETKLIRLETQVGRSGIITPVAILDPVEIGGVTINRASLHNFSEIDRLDLRIGDSVLIERAGDVIPKISSVNLKKRNPDSPKISVPTNCPSCCSPLTINKTGKLLFCKNKYACQGQLVQSILHFASANAINIKGLGESIVTELVNKKYITNILDIFRIKNKSNEIQKYTKLKDLSFNNLVQEIDRKKHVSLTKFIYSLGIPTIGEIKSEHISYHVKTPANLINNLQKINEKGQVDPIFFTKLSKQIGENSLNEIISYAQNDGNLALLRSLIEELNITGIPESIVKKSFLYGKTVTFSGSFNSFKKSEGEAISVSLGAIISKNVTKRTSLFIYGKGSGQKLGKAKKYNLKILTEDEWLYLIESCKTST